MDDPGDPWVPPTHTLVREPTDASYVVPSWIEVGDRVIGVVATGLWAIDGVYDVVAGDLRRSTATLKAIEPFVDHCGVSVPAVEARVRRALPRRPATLEVGWADRAIAAVRAETVSPTPWHRVDQSCAADSLTDYDAAIARIWGCNTCGRDPHTEFTPRFEAHRTGMRIDARIDLDITIAVCPSCQRLMQDLVAGRTHGDGADGHGTHVRPPSAMPPVRGAARRHRGGQPLRRPAPDGRHRVLGPAPRGSRLRLRELRSRVVTGQLRAEVGERRDRVVG